MDDYHPSTCAVSTCTCTYYRTAVFDFVWRIVTNFCDIRDDIRGVRRPRIRLFTPPPNPGATFSSPFAIVPAVDFKAPRRSFAADVSLSRRERRIRPGAGVAASTRR